MRIARVSVIQHLRCIHHDQPPTFVSFLFCVVEKIKYYQSGKLIETAKHEMNRKIIFNWSNFNEIGGKVKVFFKIQYSPCSFGELIILNDKYLNSI